MAQQDSKWRLVFTLSSCFRVIHPKSYMIVLAKCMLFTTSQLILVLNQIGETVAIENILDVYLDTDRN